MNVNAAVGAAVSGAGKVAGAVGSIAVAGAKQLLTGLIPRPQDKVRCLQSCLCLHVGWIASRRLAAVATPLEVPV